MHFSALVRMKRIVVGLAVLAILQGVPALSAEAPEADIWTEDAGPMQEGPWSDRRIEIFLDRLEEENPDRAAQLRMLQKENPDEFQKELKKEVDKFFRSSDRPQPPEPGEGPGGPMGPGPQRPDTREGRRGPDEDRSGEARRRRWLEHIQRRHEEFIQWLETNDPELAGELEQLRQKDEAAYFGRVMEARRRYDPILRAERDNPELAEVLKEDLLLQRQREELIREIRGAEGPRKEQLLNELRGLVSRRFDLIVRKKTLQYQELEERLKRLQRELEKRQTEVDKLKRNKEQAVQERVKELTAQAEAIHWD